MIEALVTDLDRSFVPYWDGLREGRLLLQRCPAGHVQHYPRPVCGVCLSTSSEWVESRGTGTVVASTTVHRAPLPELRVHVPYVIALIDLDDGVRVMSNVVGHPPEGVRPGLRVAVGFLEVTDEVTLPVFGPADDAPSSAWSPESA